MSVPCRRSPLQRKRECLFLGIEFPERTVSWREEFRTPAGVRKSPRNEPAGRRRHDLYVSIVKLGRVEPDAADELRQLAAAYVAELDVQAVVLAGTELALAPTQTWEGLHVIDCAALHIDAIVTASVV